MTLFASDNITPACPEVLDALVAANSGTAPSYGEDPHTTNLAARMSEVFETEVVVYPTLTGTASNALALSVLTPRYGKIFCHELAHINTDECGAPEFFSGGAKLVPLPGENLRISAERLAGNIIGHGNVHSAQPACVSLTQASEGGTVYQLEEIGALAQLAHGHGMHVHMDGARFANALVTLGISPAEMTWKAGVDVLSFGGTKNGCLAAEAVVFFNPRLAGHFAYLHKRSGQLLSKMRFVSAQLEAYLADGVWLRNARHANKMATVLSSRLADLPGVEIKYPVESNEIFMRLPETLVDALAGDGLSLNDGELDATAIRMVTAWNTSVDDIDAALAALRRHCTSARGS